MLDRRQMLQNAAMSVLLATLARTPAWAGGTPSPLDDWARKLIDLNTAVRDKSLTVTDWQSQVERHNQSVPLQELIRYLDVARLTRDVSLASRQPVPTPLRIPEEVSGGLPRGWFMAASGLGGGAMQLPHVHNNLVEVQLLLMGSARVRLADRVRDLNDAVVLRISRDEVFKPGDVFSASDQRDDFHWVTGEADRTFMLFVQVPGLEANWPYGVGGPGLVYLDAGRPLERDGTIVAPVITQAQAAAKYLSA